MVAANLKSLALRILKCLLVDNKEQNWFKRAHVGNFLGLIHIHRSTASKRRSEKDRSEN